MARINFGTGGWRAIIGDEFTRLRVGIGYRVEQLDDFVDKIHHRPLGR